jgi:hypothetical protein
MLIDARAARAPKIAREFAEIVIASNRAMRECDRGAFDSRQE